MWEDDVRRTGINRRGPPAKRKASVGFHADTTICAENLTNETDEPPVSVHHHHQHNIHFSATDHPEPGLSSVQQISLWPFLLNGPESDMLDKYINTFSRTYPALSTVDNPFLRIFIPLSMRSRVVLDAMLALGAVQSWEGGGFKMARPMLQLRQKAIRGCMDLISRVYDPLRPRPYGTTEATAPDGLMPSPTEDVIALLASCVLLLLFEKLSGESQDSATRHLQFFAQMFSSGELSVLSNQRYSFSPDMEDKPWSEIVRFLTSLFLYNDLVRSTSSCIPPISKFYVGMDTSGHHNDFQPFAPFCDPKLGRFALPSLISRVSAGDISVTDEDIASWDGRLDWFPSFALAHEKPSAAAQRLPTSDPVFVLGDAYCRLCSFARPGQLSEKDIVSEIYRIAATVYRKQCDLKHGVIPRNQTMSKSNPPEGIGTQMGNLPIWAVQLLQHLPHNSSWENCLLWPIGIVAKELNTSHEREYIMTRLRGFEQRFRLKLYHDVGEHLRRYWFAKDQGLVYVDTEPILCG